MWRGGVRSDGPGVRVWKGQGEAARRRAGHWEKKTKPKSSRAEGLKRIQGGRGGGRVAAAAAARYTTGKRAPLRCGASAQGGNHS